VHRASSTHAGYGWQHVSLPIAAYDNRLRVLIKVGHTRGHHTTVLCQVPALSLSFALGTNADVSALTSGGSVVPSITALVQTICNHLVGLENQSLQPALLFNQVVNAQLCVAPECGDGYPAFVRYASSSVKRQLAQDPAVLALIKCGGRAFQSLLDMRHIHSESNGVRTPVELRVSSNGKDVVLVESFVGGESRTHQLVYDTNVFRSNQEASQAFEQMRLGKPMPTSGCGHYRVLCPYDGLPTELVRLDVSVPSEPRIHFRGRVYVSDQTYDTVRSKVAPTLQERLKANSSAAAYANNTNEAFSYADVLQQVDSKLAGAPIDTLPIEARFGGRGWGGGGWRGGGGYGWGLGAGLVAGAALAPWYYGYPGYGYPGW
jgi:hypothetical protein